MTRATRVAALYDIHANLPALDAALAELDREGVDLVVVGGDVVWGPMPRETMELLASLTVETSFLMGNADRDVFDRVPGRWKESNDWCADRLSREQLEFLSTRPPVVSVDIGSLGPVLFCHGSPRSDTDPVTLLTSDELITDWCGGFDEKVIVCGHTHGQFDRTAAGRRIVNAGSIGNPFGDRGAYWAIFGPDDVELRLAPYDVEEAARAIRHSGFPYAETMAKQITSVSSAEDAARFFTPA